MKKKSTPLVDEHLESLAGLKEAVTDDFFYSRLRARMEDRASGVQRFVLKPVWTIAVLCVLLLMNGFMLFEQRKIKQIPSASASIESFANAYDQNVTVVY
jgi:hypothetical protein